MVPESIYNLNKVLSEYSSIKNKNCIKIFFYKKKLWKSFNEFSKSFLSYTDATLKNKSFTHRQIADYLFLSKFNTLNQYQDYLKRCLFSANSYLTHLSEKINNDNIIKYIDTLHMIAIDFEELVASIEVNLNSTATTISLRSGRSKFKKLTDIWGIARNLFFIEDLKSVHDLHLYDIKPFSVFAIRQTIEQYGKEVLGYTSITDPHGNFSKKHLYSSWEFIKLELSKPTPRITLPFDIEVMLKIEKWSHRFVHAGYYADCFVIWQALDMMRELFKSDRKAKRIHTGQSSLRMFGDVLITNYNSLKADFTIHLNSSISDPTKHVIVNWVNINNVGPYIISI